jgi:hypothetical protein
MTLQKQELDKENICKQIKERKQLNEQVLKVKLIRNSKN